MTNIAKAMGISDRLGEGSGKDAYSQQKKQLRVDKQQETKTFGDIYDVRLLAEINLSSAEFKLEEIEQANAELKNVLSEMDKIKTDEFVQAYPSDEVIELSKMAKRQ